MSLLARLLPSAINGSSKLGPKLTESVLNFHSLTCTVQRTAQEQTSVNPGGLFSQATRSVMRYHFPRPSERKRVKKHGWMKRMSTASGRRVIMNRILKGRWVYSH